MTAMTIWNYASQTKDALLNVMRSVKCVYCDSDLFRFEPLIDEKPWGDANEWRVRVCQTCGWWKITEINHLDEGNLYRAFRGAAAGNLKTLDLTNLDTPLDEVRNFLLARYEPRFNVDPYLFEKT